MNISKIIKNGKKPEINIKKDNNKNLLFPIIFFNSINLLISIIFITEIILKLILKKKIFYLEIIITLLSLILPIIFRIYLNKNKKFSEKNVENKIKSIKNILIDKKMNITKDSYNHWCSNNSFEVFQSIYNILYIVYSKKNKSIIIFNLNENKKALEIKNGHLHHINIFKYYFDKLKKKDIIMSVSCEDSNIKLWDINICQCILNLNNVNLKGIIFSACFLYEKNEGFIVTSNYNFFELSEHIKIYDFNGNKIKEINDSNKDFNYIETYYDKDLFTNYIIAGNNNDYIYSYDYNKNKLYNKYSDEVVHRNITIYRDKNSKILKLLESFNLGDIRIWDFHTCSLLNKIKISDFPIYGICLWNGKYLLAGYEDSLKLIDLKSGKIIKNLFNYNSHISCIKTLEHPLFGQCLISQGWFHEQIKLWKNFLE